MRFFTDIDSCEGLVLRVLLRLHVYFVLREFAFACLVLKLLVLFLNEFILHGKFVLSAHLPMLFKVSYAELSLLLLLSETERCWNLIIEVYLFFVKDKDVVPGDNIARRINQVASSVAHAAKFIVQF